VSRSMDSPDPPSWPRRLSGSSELKKDLLTGPNPSFCALQAQPASLRRRRCGSTGADRLQLLGLARVTLVPASGSARLGEIAAPRLMTPRHSRLGTPAISLRLRARL
jgi:hypothetical protein